MSNCCTSALRATVEFLWNKEVCVEQKHLVSHCWVPSAKTLSLSSLPSPGATLLCKRTEGKHIFGRSFPHHLSLLLSLFLFRYFFIYISVLLCVSALLIKADCNPQHNPALPLLGRSHLAVKQLISELMVCYAMSYICSSIEVSGTCPLSIK